MNFSPGFKQFVNAILDILVKPFAFFTLVFVVGALTLFVVSFLFGDGKVLHTLAYALSVLVTYGFCGTLIYRWFKRSNESIADFAILLGVLVLFGPFIDMIFIDDSTYIDSLLSWATKIVWYAVGVTLYQYFAPKVGLLPIQDRYQDEE